MTETLKTQTQRILDTIDRVFDEYKQRHSSELGYRNYHFENGILVPDTL